MPGRFWSTEVSPPPILTARSIMFFGNQSVFHRIASCSICASFQSVFVIKYIVSAWIAGLCEHPQVILPVLSMPMGPTPQQNSQLMPTGFVARLR